MLTTFNQDNLDKVFEALGNQHRREIVYALGLQPHSISQLATMRGLSLPAIHKHLKILENANLIKSKKFGRSNFLTINRQSLIGLQKWLMQYHAHWGSDEETLENYVDYLKTGNTRGGGKKK
jgi:DNA-binding transcriptional ArsR family regulator